MDLNDEEGRLASFFSVGRELPSVHIKRFSFFFFASSWYFFLFTRLNFEYFHLFISLISDLLLLLAVLKEIIGDKKNLLDWNKSLRSKWINLFKLELLSAWEHRYSLFVYFYGIMAWMIAIYHWKLYTIFVVASVSQDLRGIALLL